MSTRILREPNGQPFRPIPARGRVRRTRPHACGKTCPKHHLSAAEKDAMLRAAAEFLNDSYEVLTGTGAHADHQPEQVGRCVVCSCGMRFQGRLDRG